MGTIYDYSAKALNGSDVSLKDYEGKVAGLDGKTIKFLVDTEEPVMAGQVIAEVEE